jgi:adenylate cyclase
VSIQDARIPLGTSQPVELSAEASCMNGLMHTPPGPWTSYVPQHIASDAESYLRLDRLGHVERFDAVGLFADVSGFTAMSEALARAGSFGAEELSGILNGFFEPMIELVHAYGGSVEKFAGDAMVILFPYARRSQQGAVRRAMRCALDMQDSMTQFERIGTSVGAFTLSMKIGLAEGGALSTVVGDPNVRLEHILAGGAIDRAVAAEQHALPGEAVVGKGLVQLARSVEFAQRQDGLKTLIRVKGRISKPPLGRTIRVSDASQKALARFLHPAIADRLATGVEAFVNEHRRVTVLFAAFPQLDYENDRSVGGQLQRYFRAVIETVQSYDGHLRQVDIGDKGSKYIVVFGAPVTHEDDVERSLRCALELRGVLDLPTRAGVSTGLAYCGRVGSNARQEYAVVGDSVNLAARLMEAARPGQILVSGTTQKSAAEAFEWEELGPLALKGKTEAVPVFALERQHAGEIGRLQEPRYELPMVGRRDLLGAAIKRMELAKRGRGQTIAITGEAGIGKSRLCAEVIRLARDRGFAFLGGTCQAYGAATSFLVWRGIWQSFFALDPSQSQADQLRQTEGMLTAMEPSLAERLPLLQPVLNLPIPDNELTGSLNEELRAELLRPLLLDCLRHRSGETPLLLVLEDCHWIDPASRDLLDFVGRNLLSVPVLLVILYRSPTWEDSPVASLDKGASFQEIRLEALPSKEAHDLARIKLEHLFGASPAIAATLSERIVAQAEGNPLFIEELLSFMHARGINPHDVRAARALELPESIQSLLMARIDQLGESEKTTLRVASVIGRLFRASWVSGAYPQAGSLKRVREHLDVLDRLDLVSRHRPEPELEYVFRHALTQEVAYGSMTFAARETLHEEVGDFIEHAYGQSLDQHLDVLAYHFGRSRNAEKQRLYFRRAGDAAKDAYANESAADYYERLLPLVPQREQADVMRKLGEVSQLTGDWRRAESLYRRGLELAEAAGEDVDLARSRCALGYLLSFTESHEAALVWLEQARADFERLRDPVGLGRVLDYLGSAYFELSDYPRAIECAQKQLEVARERGDGAGISAACDNLGRVYWHMGDDAEALQCLHEALAVADESGDRRAAIHARNDIAGLYAQRGDFARSFTFLEEALASALEIGYKLVAGIIIGNAGELYRRQGYYDRAVACHAHAIDMAVEMGDWTGLLLTNVGEMAIACAGQGRDREADLLFERAIALGRSLKAQYFLCGYLQYRAELHARQGRNADAWRLNQEAIELAAAAGHREIHHRAELRAVKLRLILGLTDEDQAAEDLSAMLDRSSEDHERARIQYELWTLDKSRESARKAAAELFKEALARTPDVEYLHRYEELTGAHSPLSPGTLPPLPQGVTETAPSIPELIARIDALTEAAE